MRLPEGFFLEDTYGRSVTTGVYHWLPARYFVVGSALEETCEQVRVQIWSIALMRKSLK